VKKLNHKRQNTILFVLGALSAIAPFSVDMYLPGFPAIAHDLRTDVSYVGLTLTSYFIGLSMGQLMFGPVIDRFGRKKPLMVGLLVYILAAVGCAFSPSIYYLISLRLFLAMGCCVGMVGGSSVIRDLFSGREVARAMSMMMTIFGVAPIIAPTIGGLIVATLGWRFIFGVLAIIGTFVLIAIKEVLPETKEANLSISLRPKNVTLDYLKVFRERQFVIYILAGAAGSGGLFSYITGSPFVYINLLDFTATQFGWMFGMNALAVVVGNQVNRVSLRKYDSAQILPVVTALQSATGILLLTGSLLGFLPKMAFVSLMVLFLFCFGFINPNSAALALQPFSRNVGSASAIMGSTIMISGALASGLVSYFHNRTAVPMTLMMAFYPSISFILMTIGQRFIRLHHRNTWRR
jgi:DHA1 family bicyclomycin/chloramphenicol resistance-like MFS transporter